MKRQQQNEVNREWFYRAERRNERAKRHDARLGEQFRHFGHTSDVLLSIGIGESQIGIETEAHVVPVEAECWNASSDQVILQRERQRRLTSTGKSFRLEIVGNYLNPIIRFKNTNLPVNHKVHPRNLPVPITLPRTFLSTNGRW